MTALYSGCATFVLSTAQVPNAACSAEIALLPSGNLKAPENGVQPLGLLEDSAVTRLAGMSLVVVIWTSSAIAQPQQALLPQGARVSKIKFKDAPANKAGLEVGDVIERIDGEQITDAATYKHLLKQAVQDRTSARLRIFDVRTGNRIDRDISPAPGGNLGIRYRITSGIAPPIDNNNDDKPPKKNAQPTVYAILVIFGADSRLADGFDSNGRMMTKLLKTQLPNQYQITWLRSSRNQCSWDRIQKTIADSPARPGIDTLFCFWAGHGGWSQPDGHILTVQGPLAEDATVARSNLLQGLLNKNAKLTVLLTDSCAKESGVAPRYGGEEQMPRAPIVRSLFLDHTGVVNVNGCSPGQASWYIRGVGTTFTTPGVDSGGLFCQAFCSNCLIRSNPMTWPEFFAVVGADTDDAFQRVIPEEKKTEERQMNQSPYEFTPWKQVHFDRPQQGNLVPAGGREDED